MSGSHISLQSSFAVISKQPNYPSKTLRGANLLEEVQMPHFLLGKMEKEDLFNIYAGRLKLHKAQEVLWECGSVWCFQTTNIVLKIPPVLVNYMRARLTGLWFGGSFKHS